MKKAAFFLTVFLFFSFLIAEEVKNDSSEPLPQPETTQETVKRDDSDIELAEPQLQSETAQETVGNTGLKQAEKYKIFHFQPTVGVGAGLFSMLRLNANLDFYFKVKDTPSDYNIYLGFGAGLYFAPIWEYFSEYPVYGNFVVDFTTRRSRVLKSVGLRIEAGCQMLYWEAHKSIMGFEVKDTLFYWFIFGISTDLLFKHNVVLRIGIENGELILPTVSMAIGYRF